MAVILNTALKATETRADVDPLKVIAIFCLVGLAASLIVASYGVDVSWAFF
jgi:hypothetical protein